MRKHLAVMDKISAEAILSGIKTIETRFSKHRIPPFGMISIGDVVYIKASGEDIIGQFKAKKVISYEGLTPHDINKIFEEYGKQISVGDKKWDEKYFNSKKESIFGTLIFVGQSERFITSPIKFKKSDMRGWVVLEEKQS